MIGLPLIWALCLLTFLVNGCFPIDLTILHTNDVHAQFVSRNDLNEKCSVEDVANKNCFGGAARRMTIVKEFREREENVLLLDAGDQFQGSTWFIRMLEAPYIPVMNLLGYDAMVVGNHEFDADLPPFGRLVRNVNFPILGTNFETKDEEVNGLLVDYVRLNIDGMPAAILGVLSTETADSSAFGFQLDIEVPEKALKKWVPYLRSQGVKFIIVLSHCGLSYELNICANVPGINVVIGAHSHSFLYNGLPPSLEKPVGSYPEVVRTADGPCLVATAFHSGKYLGNLKLSIDNRTGVITSWHGQPILVDSSFDEDPEMVQVLKPFEEELEMYDSRPVGYSAVALDSSSSLCRHQECNIGNVLTDSMIHAGLSDTGLVDGQWALSSIAVLNGGAIRSYRKARPGVVFARDVLQIYPFDSTLVVLKIRGRKLLNMLEWSVRNYFGFEHSAAFLQYSGVHVTFDLSRPIGSRVKEVTVRCSNCSLPSYAPLDESQVYSITTSLFLRNGGDGYVFDDDDIIEEWVTSTSIVEAVESYLSSIGIMFTGREERIKLLNVADPQ